MSSDSFDSEEENQTAKCAGREIYTLIHELWDHAGDYERDILGRFDSKDAAICEANEFRTHNGTFDKAVEDIFGDEDDYIDNRDNPPDNGILMQLGSVNSGEGDYERFIIKKSVARSSNSKDSAKKRGRPKGSTDSSAKKKKGDKSDGINLNIPDTTIEKIRDKVKSIVEHANREELTVKDVRKMLEEWFDTDLSEHKELVRSLVMDAM